MMVYCLKAQPQLLAGQQLPKDDLETIEQW